uniref:Uncharacterized protein n=1 Tax=Lepeophtheirus salmonis TaxID=72036 RepID=A0A0K2V008_LEPSM
MYSSLFFYFSYGLTILVLLERRSSMGKVCRRNYSLLFYLVVPRERNIFNTYGFEN